MLRKLSAAWTASWNQFDRLVDWYFIGDTRKLYQTATDVEVVETQPRDVTPVAERPAATATLSLDLTPVTEFLGSLTQNYPYKEDGTSSVRLVCIASGTVSKDFQFPESNEDAFAWDELNQRAAVFDGATESFAAKRWVALVRDAWLAGNSTWLDGAQKAYEDSIQDLNLSWAQSEAAERGSHTTIVSVESNSMGLVVTTVGDSCIFLLDGDRIIGAAPYTSQGEFFASPLALSTRHQDHNTVFQQESTFILPAEMVAGKQLLLATDALSQWLLIDQPQERLQRLIDALISNGLEELVRHERASGDIKADDTSALLLDVTFGEAS